jgi:RND family efflux transporter MFP subunit
VTGAKSAYDSTDLTAAQANVTQAQGALDAAKATLEKTVVRSPITGTIVSLPVTEGDYLPAFSQVAVVSNPQALYIDTHVTPDDAKTLAVGNTALIDTATKGIITFIAPAIDPATSKIEVKVGITGTAEALTDGEVVNIALDRNHEAPATAQNTAIVIPISAVKITPNTPIIFTIGTSSTLVAHPVTLGSILGDRVIILTGLTPDMDIVTDARGLAEGQEVLTN